MSEEQQNETDRQKFLSDFVEITGAGEEEARNILEATSYNFEYAMNLYWECPQPNMTLFDEVESLYPNYPQHGPLGEGYEHSYQQEEEEEEKAVEENVRAPIPVKRQKLIQDNIPQDFYSRKEPESLHSSVFSANSRSTTYPLTSKDNKLIQLFKPPVKILFPGPFQEARNEAKKQNKWLMINIQRDEEFFSHVLNRDVWSDEGMQELVQCNFIFWQRQDTSPEGRTFRGLYTANISPPCRYPYVCIINPLTGYSEISILTSSMYEELTPIVRNKIFEKLQDFLSSNPSPSVAQDKRDRKICEMSRIGRGESISATSSSTSTTGTTTGATEEGRGETAKSTTTTSSELTHKRNFKEFEDLPENENLSVSSPPNESNQTESSQSQSQSLSQNSNGFLVSELKKILPTPPEILTSQSKSLPSSTIRLIYPSGFKFDYVIPSSDDESNFLTLLSVVVSQLPTDQTLQRIDLFYGFPPVSLFQHLCRRQQEGSSSSSTNTRTNTLRDLLSETKLECLQLGGEKVTIRYVE